MPKRKAKPQVTVEYSPEFKLRVVLQYLQDPQQAKQICVENQIGEELLTFWHQEFIARANQIFGFSSPAQVASAVNSSNGGPRYTGQVEKVVPSWGLRINYEKYGSYKSASSSNEPPAWLGPVEREKWKSKRGVVIWDNPPQKLEVISAKQALELVETFGKTTEWRTEGIPIIQRIPSSPMPAAPELKRPAKKSNAKAKEEKVVSDRPHAEVERMRLSPQAAPEFLAFLAEHESILQQMAEEDAKEQEQFWKTLIHLLLSGAREGSAKDIDLSTRPLSWVRDDSSETWVCDLPPNRGTVVAESNGWFWQSCIEEPNEFKRYSPYFIRLGEVLAWTEQELMAIQKKNEDAKQKIELSKDETAIRPRMDLTPYRIDPSALEPARITYRAVIELEHAPDSFKTWEMSFGKLYRYDEKFPSVAGITGRLQLDPKQIEVEKRFGISDGGYLIYSTTTQDDEKTAKQLTRQLWDHSGIHQLYKVGKVMRARYGIEEVETGYITWLGELEDLEHPWKKAGSRVEHMTNWAMLETLAYALDVNGFRERFGIQVDSMSDDDLLAVLHERRARSICVPANVRGESEQWLGDHDHETMRGKKKLKAPKEME
ncbi:MAG: transposase [Nitrospirae bacterium]|nr:transposase [Nitrospirota bacterium]